MIKQILVTGSLAFDQIMDFPQSFEENILPEKIKALSVSFLAENFSKNFGGVAGNIAYNLALLNQEAFILSSAGKKDFAPYLKHLRRVGVQTKCINQLKDSFTANMFLITDKNNCQIAGFFPGTMTKDHELSITKAAKKIKKLDFLVIAPTVPETMENFIREAKSLKIPYLFDPAQQIPRLTKDQLKIGITGAEILIGNDYELALIIKKTGLEKEELLEKVKILITTLGEKGSQIETKRRKIKIGIVKAERLTDPTGAGDGYISGFLAAYLCRLPLKICGQLGATVAAYAVERYGTQSHSFTLPQVKKRYLDTFGKILEFS